MFRTVNAKILAPVLRLTGFRFSKDYRWGTSAKHRIVYALVDVVTANIQAGA